MKFNKRPRYPFRDTARKRSFIPIKNRREQEKLPLFAELIAESQNHDVDAIMADRADRWGAAEARERSERAKKWIDLRRHLRLLPDRERLAFLAYYYRVRFPLDPGYLHSVLHDFLRGRYLMVGGAVVAKSHLDFLADRAAEIAAMPEEELLRRIQSPYADERYRDELRLERSRRFQLQSTTSRAQPHPTSISGGTL